jgi:hypothetical protein
MKFFVQLLSDVVLLEGVPIWVTRVSNKVKPCIISQPQFYPLNNRSLWFFIVMLMAKIYSHIKEIVPIV